MSGNWKKQSAGITANCQRVRAHLANALDTYGPFVLCALSQELLVDLRDKLNNTEKIRIVDEMLECINKAVEVYDPKEKNDSVRAAAVQLAGLILQEVE